MGSSSITRAIAVCTLLAAVGAAAAAGDPVPWKNAEPNAARPVDREAALQQLADLAARPTAHHAVIRFERALSAPERQTLASAGVHLLRPLGPDAYFAKLGANINRAAVAASPFVDAAAITRANKLHPDLLTAAPPSWSIVSTKPLAANPEAANAEPISETNPMVGVYLVFHPDFSALGVPATNLINAVGGTVRDVLVSVNGLVVELPLSSVARLADDDRVQWIEPPLPPMDILNSSNRARVQADIAQAPPYNLDGSGVTVLIYDAGTARSTHLDFSGRDTVIDASGTNYHSTHVAGTVGGDGSVIFNNRGMAPGVSLISAGFEYDGSGTFLYTNPGDIEDDYAAGMTMGASISNNSIGSNVAPNGFPCSYEGDYGLCAATIDNIIRGALGDHIVIFWSAGNERGGFQSCGATYNTSPPPANNKNAITVGALNSNDDSMTDFSSWGPSDDGRLRPVLAGPGCQSNDDGGVTSTDSASDTAYTVLCGTSMSGPTLAGMGALIYEDFRLSFPAFPDPSNQLMKIWLCHTCVDLGNPGPDYQYGYGSARVVDAIDFMRTGRWIEESVDQGGVAAYTADIPASTPQLKITMAWDDPAGTPNVNPNLVNNLDLVVISPSGVRHYPWTLNPSSPASPAVRTQVDNLNNIEQVVVDNPEAGLWRVEVHGTSVPDGPQGFALCASPTLSAGLLSVGLLTPLPALYPPDTAFDVEAQIFEGADALVPGSVTLHYRHNPGPFTDVVMSDLGSTYGATIPGASCDENIEFYVSAQGDQAGLITIPTAGASSPYSTNIGVISVLLDDNMETNMGWSVSGNASTGQWERGVPVGGGDRGDPASDYDGSGQCWLTGNTDGDSDIDGGSTVLTSPAYDVSASPEAVISYARWYNNVAGAAPNEDTFVVEISNNNGASWSNLETVGPAGPGTAGGWFDVSFRIADYVAPTSQVRLRFTASDLGSGSVVEAGVDAIHIEEQTCEDAGGCNAADLALPYDQLDFTDVTTFLVLFSQMDPAADLALPFAQWDFTDVTTFLTIFGGGCP
ncbi:MAG: S8 family serine peptidase [Phycisphaerales bacterium]